MIGFLHVPKTGGTSVRMAFEASGRSVYRPTGPLYTERLPSRAEIAGFDVVTGHIPFDVLTSVEPDELVTVLRDPIDRWLSHYFAFAESVDQPDPDIVPTDMTVRMLSTFDAPDLERAAVNLARFDHVGCTDRLDDTFARYGLTPTHQRRSGTRRGARSVPFPSWLRDAAIERNQLDIQLIQETHA